MKAILKENVKSRGIVEYTFIQLQYLTIIEPVFVSACN